MSIVTLWHYTDRKGAESILKSKKIRMSLKTGISGGWRNTDAIKGEGVYFSDKEPGQYR